MKVLVTRPTGNAATTIERLANLGHSVLHEPLLRVEERGTSLPEGSFGGVILTSSNAIKPLDRGWTLPRRDTPVFTTGEATAKAVRMIGFEKVVAANGSAPDLVRKLPRFTKSGLELLYPCAESPAHDVPELLRDKQVTCTPWPCYRTIPVEHFSSAVDTALSEGTIDVVLLYSARTAACFVELITNGDFQVPRLLVLSEEICKSMPERMQRLCRFPDRPDERKLLKLL